MNCVVISANRTRRTAGSRRCTASAIRGLWNAPVTRSRTALPPLALAASLTAATPSHPPPTSVPAPGLDSAARRGNAVLRPGNDHLAGEVVVRRPHAVVLAA